MEHHELRSTASAPHSSPSQQQIICAKVESLKHVLQTWGVILIQAARRRTRIASSPHNSLKAERTRGSSTPLTCNEGCILKLQAAMTRDALLDKCITACTHYPIQLFGGYRSPFMRRRTAKPQYFLSPANSVTSVLVLIIHTDGQKIP